MEAELSLEFLRVVENGAIAAARTMGFGDRHKADEVAVEAMRETMDGVQMDGTIVIGEGERDEAPMLYIGKRGDWRGTRRTRCFPRWILRWTRLKGRTFAQRVRRGRLPCWRRANAEDYCTRRICTWKKS